MLEREDSPDPLSELIHVIRQLTTAGSGQAALFPDENVSAGELVRAFDQRALAVRDSYDDRLSPSQLESLTALEKKLSTMSRDGAEFDADEKTHPLILPWDQLPDRYKKADMSWPQQLIHMLNDQGYAVIDKNELDRLMRKLRQM